MHAINEKPIVKDRNGGTEGWKKSRIEIKGTIFLTGILSQSEKSGWDICMETSEAVNGWMQSRVGKGRNAVSIEPDIATGNYSTHSI